ncbi:hypothetical protein CEP54_011985 [Fusarium duplospermum]|uniref:Uncharacterized protein n=1 Tax=Fusarium duplospermum TaxID=1325734 RepID=A0A428PB93_9HYPO|nr:hypothetical protein CEP54_011985 [Fusarium duplospermum]
MSLQSTLMSLLALLATIVVANDPIPESAFEIASAPMYHFGRSWDRAPCYPEAAEINGEQVQGHHSDECIGIQNEGCADLGPWNGVNSPGNGFPVYYTVRNDGDLLDQGAQDRNHAKLYQGFFYHATFQTRKTSLNTCANTNDEFRSWDWHFLPDSAWLYDGDLIKTYETMLVGSVVVVDEV